MVSLLAQRAASIASLSHDGNADLAPDPLRPRRGTSVGPGRPAHLTRHRPQGEVRLVSARFDPVEPTPRQRALRRLVVFADAALVLVSMGLAFALHAALRAVLPLLREPPAFHHWALLLYLAMPLFVATSVTLGMHRSFEQRYSPARLVGELLQLHVAVLVGLTLLVYVAQAVINRSLVALFLFCTFVLLFAERALIARWQRYQHRSGQGRERLLVVGDDAAAMQRFAESAEREPFPPQFAGYLVPTGGAPLPGLALAARGGLDRLETVLREEAVDRVLFFPRVPEAEPLQVALAQCDAVGVPVGVAVDTPEIAGLAPHLDEHLGRPFITFERVSRPPASLALKSAFDVAVAALVIVALAPLLAVIALAVWVTAGRPILFSQERAGLHFRRFRMLKFRTMVRDAEEKKKELLERNEMAGPVFKLSDDPRVTRLGRVLRRTSLDELPQLFNVLAGQMSLVGPRPLPVNEQQRIRGWHRRRLSMKPGMTGLWQVSGRNELSFEEWMALDLRYVDEWSLGRDARILARTLPAVLAAKGAR